MPIIKPRSFTKLHPLEQWRLEHYLTYRELADRVREATGCARTSETYRKICRREAEPLDPLRFAIDLFLAKMATPRQGAAR